MISATSGEFVVLATWVGVSAAHLGKAGKLVWVEPGRRVAEVGAHHSRDAGRNFCLPFTCYRVIMNS